MRSFLPHHAVLPSLLIIAALWSLGVSCSLLSGVRRTATSTPAPTATVAATLAAQPQFAITLPAEPSATAALPAVQATQTSAPQVVATPAQLAAQAPWLVISTFDGIWMANPDGS
jgi:hypothetical protein